MEKRIDYLVEWLNEHTVEYHMGNPTVGDTEWDKRYFELEKLENETGYVREDSPTHSIKDDFFGEFKKVVHRYPMLSLRKSSTIRDTKNFVTKLRFGTREMIISAKMDGFSCRLTYEFGRLVRAETRGNGFVGEDITRNAQYFEGVPTYVKPLKDIPKISIDGEVISTLENLKRFPQYSNARAFAASAHKTLDPKAIQVFNFRFVLWGGPELEYKYWDQLKECGFYIVPNIVEKAGELWKGDLLEQDFEKIKHMSEENSYPIDGIVIRILNLEDFKSQGETKHHPKGAIAYKFKDEVFYTYLTSINYEVTKNGILTPVAEFEPIVIDGSTISNATLHNLTIMKEILGTPFIGQEIGIIKAKQVIPRIVEAEPYVGQSDVIEIPKHCPSCGGILEVDKTTESHKLRCVNPNCQGAFIDRLNHFVSGNAMNIKGLSVKYLERLRDAGWINKIIDIYSLKDHKDEWIMMDGFGPIIVNKLINVIEESKKNTLPRFIFALGIKGVGKGMAGDLALAFGSYEEFRKADSYLSIPGIGNIINEQILSYDFTEADEIYKLLELSNDLEKPENEVLVKVAISGKLTKPRSQYQKILKELGFSFTDRVTRKTNILICNEKDRESIKAQYAMKLQIPIYTEEEFLKKFDSEKNF